MNGFEKNDFSEWRSVSNTYQLDILDVGSIVRNCEGVFYVLLFAVGGYVVPLKILGIKWTSGVYLDLGTTELYIKPLRNVMG